MPAVPLAWFSAAPDTHGGHPPVILKTKMVIVGDP